MARHKLLKANYVKAGSSVGQEVEIPDEQVSLYVGNGVIEAPKVEKDSPKDPSKK